jgi:Protein of unknown function (DUF1501)
MMHSFRKSLPTRREMLTQSANGFGMLALSAMLADEAKADVKLNAPIQDPLAPKAPQFPAKAKRVIFLFMHGGPSQVDTFDYKPLLDRDDGKPLPFNKPRVVSGQTGNLLKSPWSFKQHGQSGAWASELFPEIASHTGSDTFVRPSMGSWVTYGLGTENRNLPGFITVCPTLSHGAENNFSSAFLPAIYQGTPVGNAGTPSDKAKIPFITGDTPTQLQRMEIDFFNRMNRERLQVTGPDNGLEGRIDSFELAFRMQATAPQLQDLSNETPLTQKLYGLDDPATANYGRQCLMARRFAEAGVRFIQISHSYKWDQHGNLRKDHAKNAREVDRPIAGLLYDLKQRGLLEDTLVWWGGEFGRTPTAQGGDGRDHNPHGFTMWLAGGGIKPGISYGATDDYGYYSVENKVHFHDLHATILHQLGLDHEKLTYKHAGRNFRLTDVHGRVVREILA